MSVGATSTTVPPTTNNTTNTGTANSSSGSGIASLSSDFNSFLTLLTTQLQNQDPTSPTDPNAFTQELVEFAGVQQQVQGNSYLQQILAASQANAVSSASSYIGTTIQASGNQGSLSAGGTATFGYTLPAAAASAQVTIKDSNGNIVYQGTGTTTAGSNTVSWNGKNSFTGVAEPAGVYTMSVSAVDSQGKTITATPFITGTVQSASLSNGVVELDLGNGLEVPTTSVTSVNNLNGSSGSGLSSTLASLQSSITSLGNEVTSLGATLASLLSGAA